MQKKERKVTRKERKISTDYCTNLCLFFYKKSALFRKFETAFYINYIPFFKILVKFPNDIEFKKNRIIIKILIFLEIQRARFFRFIKFGLKIELQRQHVWFQHLSSEWTFYPKRLCIEEPIQSYQESFIR